MASCQHNKENQFKGDFPFSAKYNIDALPGRQAKFFAIALGSAQDSDMYQRHGAVCAFNSEVVASGCNEGKRQRFNKQNVCSAHAELSVLWQYVPGKYSAMYKFFCEKNNNWLRDSSNQVV